MLGAGGAALVAGLFSRNDARAGHDSTTVLHLGVVNTTADGGWTGLDANVDREAFGLQNRGTGGGIHVTTRGGSPLVGNVIAPAGGNAVVGASSLEEGQAAFGRGAGTGVMGSSGSGFGVSGNAEGGTGVHGASDTGTGGFFRSNSGEALHAEGPASVRASTGFFALDVNNQETGENAGGVIATSHGSLPAVQGNGAGPGVTGVLGISHDTDFPGGQPNGSAPGVGGASGTGPGVYGASQSGPGVRGHSDTGFAGEFNGVSGLGLAVGGRAQIGADVDAHALSVHNENPGGNAGGIAANSSGGMAAVQGNASGPGFGVIGVSSASSDPADFGQGSAVGVQGVAGSGHGVLGNARDGTGVQGTSENGVGVQGHSQTGTGGEFASASGVALFVGGRAHFGADSESFALSVDNTNMAEEAGGLYVTGHGGKPAIEGDAFPGEFGPGIGVQGVSGGGETFGREAGIGVQGVSGSGVGVDGFCESGLGVQGQSNTGMGGKFTNISGRGVGVQGNSFGGAADEEPGVGVQGLTDTGIAVHGKSDSGTGIEGVSETGEGIHGFSTSGTAARFTSGTPGGTALVVEGRAAFVTAGSASIPAGQSSVFVPQVEVTSDSHISVTLTSDPGNRQLKWVERDPGSGFTVHLAGGPPKGRPPEISLTYLVVEPAQILAG